MAEGNSDENSLVALEKELLSPYNYLLQIKGKEIRSKFLLAFNHWLNIPSDKLQEILNLVNMLHSVSLLLDDIQDDSKVRRGLPAAHCVFGIPLTINSSLHVICLAYAKARALDSKGGDIMMKHFLEALRGQGSDVYWRDNFICPTEKHYQKMVEQKTGEIFIMAVQLMQLFSENKTDHSKLVSLLGRYFQIRDDYCNLKQHQVLKENTFCEDITEGKFSFPVIHAMNTSEGEEILNILRKRTKDVSLKKHFVSLLEKAGSLQYTRDKLHELDREARTELAGYGSNSMMEVVLDELLSWKT